MGRVAYLAEGSASANRPPRYLGTSGLVNGASYAVMRGAANGITFSSFTLERQPGRKPEVANSSDSHRRSVDGTRRFVRNL